MFSPIPIRRLDRVRTAAAVLVMLGYGMSGSVSSAWQGLELGAHIATAHGGHDAVGMAATETATTSPPAAAVSSHDRPSAHRHADGHHNASSHEHEERDLPPSAHSPVGAHDHEAPHGKAPSEPLRADTARPVDAPTARDAVHTHDGVAHRHTPTESEHGAPPPPQLDKHRLPSSPALRAPTARRGGAVGASREEEGTGYESVETPPPVRA